MGRSVHWRAPPLAVPLPSPPRPMATFAAPPLDAMKVAWERPLFEPSRRMVPVSASPTKTETPVAKLAGLVLTGTVLAGALQVALVKDVSGKDTRIPKGGSYQGWTLVSLESRRAVFRNGEATDEVTFLARDGVPSRERISEDESAPQMTPMMTLEAGSHAAASAAMDDVAARQLRLEALKDLVSRRRAEPSDKTGVQ